MAPLKAQANYLAPSKAQCYIAPSKVWANYVALFYQKPKVINTWQIIYYKYFTWSSMMNNSLQINFFKFLNP